MNAVNAKSALAQDQSVPEQMRVRREKRQRLLDQGRDPYPVTVPVTTTISRVRAKHEGLEADSKTGETVGVAGRVVYLRNTGRLCFVTLQEGSGALLQVMPSQAEVGAESLAAFESDIDLGDHLFAHGRVIASRRGELSVFADAWQLAAQALRPLPVLHKDSSEESRVRKRYLDLIVRDTAREMVRTRAAVMRSLRENFHARDFIEIETPMLQTLHGGAAARPFSTHINAFDLEVSLRIAPEVFLKRAVVGGLERLFEINRNFRNERADSSHSPEFAMLEAYEAYSDYHGMADLTQDLVQKAALDVFGTTTVELADGTDYDLGGNWARIDLYSSLSEAIGEEITPATPLADLLAHAKRLEVEIDEEIAIPGKVVEELWELLVGDHLHAPTFVLDYPA